MDRLLGLVDAHDFEWSKDEKIFAIGRQPKNIDPARLRDVPLHQFIEKGFMNFIEYVGKDVADTGEVLILVEGVPLRAHASSRFERTREVALITGTIYSPKVCDFTVTYFDDVNCKFSRVLELPSDVKIRERDNRVAPAFKEMASRTSDEFIVTITETMTSARLYVAKYDIPFESELDEPLMWSRIASLDEIGSLFEPGQKLPLLAAELTERRRVKAQMKRYQKLAAADPFAIVAVRSGYVPCHIHRLVHATQYGTRLESQCVA